jgi:uncharacterized protein with von Willebrand factor type A (vWA) domain
MPADRDLTNRYSRWDGTQEVAPLDAAEILRALADDLMRDGDLDLAMQRLFRFGYQAESGQEFPGLRDLMQQVREKKRQAQQQFDMGSVLREIEAKLSEVIDLERETITRRVAEGRERLDAAAADPDASAVALSDAPDADLQAMLEQIAARKSAQLDALPPDAAGKIRGLQDYEFLSPEAARSFRELLDMLQQQVLNRTFQGMQQSLGDMSAEDIAAMRQMLEELDEMFQRRDRGEDPGFDEFMDRWGHFFGERPDSLEGLMRQMQQRMAAMRQLLDGMSPEQRSQLEQASSAALQDPGLQAAMQKLGERLAQTAGPDWRQQFRFTGDQPLSLQQATRVLDDLKALDDLERDLRDARDWRDLAALDDDRIADLLGAEQAEQFDRLSKIARTLEDAGLIKETRNGYELTPQGVRKIGEKALADIFLHLRKDKPGSHELGRAGTAGERLDASKPYEFGDPFLLDLPKTVMNAVQRGAGSPVRLAPDDFEVYRTEHATRSSTVLMIDMSRSMFYNGCFAAARKVALALDSLIRSKYPRDDFAIIGFSSIAQELKATDLPTLEWNEYTYGTNMQHGFEMARRILGRGRGSNKQIIIITDGEPTAHIEDGQVQFQYPPAPRTLRETLKEVVRCTREGITINTFMLEQSPYMVNFVDDLMKINRGRVFVATPERLGEYILVDYVRGKRAFIG